MRRIVTILAGAALALALVGPAVAGATDKASNSDATITAQHYRGGHGGHGHGDYRDGGRYRHGYYHRGGRCYGCDGPGSRCDRYGCGYRYGYYYGYPYGYYGGYYGGYGCNYDYPCGPPYSERYDCSRYRGPDGKAAQDPNCKWNDRCQCYYHGSTPPSGSEKQGPPPSGNAQPAPDQGQGGQPGPDQGMQPGPDQGQQPPPSQGGEPKPY